MTPPLLRFSANLSWLFTEVPLEQRFAAAAAAGFRGVEVAAPYSIPIPQLRDLLTRHDLELVLLNLPAGEPGTPTQWGLACHPDRTTEFRAAVGTALEYANGTGCRLVHVVGGTVPDGVTAAEALAAYEANVRWAVGRAEAAGVTLLLEVLNQGDAPGFVLHRVDQATTLIREIDSPHLRLLLDLYHLELTEGSVLGPLEEHLPVAAHLQLAQPPTRSEPGTGTVDWAEVFSRLRQAGYPGWIGCEYRPSTTTAASLDWLDRIPGPVSPARP